MKLTKKEEAWIERFKNTMASAPETLGSKMSSYTIGDNEITLYDKEVFDNYFEENPEHSWSSLDHCALVEESSSELMYIRFPFSVESTAG